MTPRAWLAGLTLGAGLLVSAPALGADPFPTQVTVGRQAPEPRPERPARPAPAPGVPVVARGVRIADVNVSGLTALAAGKAVQERYIAARHQPLVANCPRAPDSPGPPRARLPAPTSARPSGPPWPREDGRAGGMGGGR